MSAGDVIQRFHGVRRTRRGWSAQCSGHDDRENSLSLAIGDDGRVLVNCFAGCSARAIVAAVGLQLRDLFPDGSSPRLRTSVRPSSTSPLDEARREVLLEGRRQLARLDLKGYADADAERIERRLIDHARVAATQRGDCEEAWEVLALAAEIERALAAEGRT